MSGNERRRTADSELQTTRTTTPETEQLADNSWARALLACITTRSGCQHAARFNWNFAGLAGCQLSNKEASRKIKIACMRTTAKPSSSNTPQQQQQHTAIILRSIFYMRFWPSNGTEERDFCPFHTPETV